MKVVIEISPSLKYLFESLEEHIDLKFKPDALNQVLTDMQKDQISANEYILSADGHKKRVMGLVEEYEPETIWLIFENLSRKKESRLKTIFDNFEFGFGTGAGYRPEEESLAIFLKGVDQM